MIAINTASARPLEREVDAPVEETDGDAFKSELDGQKAAKPAAKKKSIDAEQPDATRAAQDQLGQAPAKLSLVPDEPTLGTPDAGTAQVAPAAAPSASPLEQAVHALLDQMQSQAAPAAPAAPAAVLAQMTPVTEQQQQLTAAIDELVATITDQTKAEDQAEDEPSPTKLDGTLDPTITPDLGVKPTIDPAPSKGPTAVVAVREPAPLPENSNPSHVHLVIGEGTERMVVTVNVRGSEVNATVRGGDEQTAASLARNAASLDHAMRARGLDLSNFTSERELGHDQRERHQPPRDDQDREETTVFRMQEHT